MPDAFGRLVSPPDRLASFSRASLVSSGDQRERSSRFQLSPHSWQLRAQFKRRKSGHGRTQG